MKSAFSKGRNGPPTELPSTHPKRGVSGKEPSQKQRAEGVYLLQLGCGKWARTDHSTNRITRRRIATMQLRKVAFRARHASRGRFETRVRANLDVQEDPRTQNGRHGTATRVQKTKVVATIGPASCEAEQFYSLAENGMCVARLNMSHGNHESHMKVVEVVRSYNRRAAERHEPLVAVMLDTKGPEVRSGDLSDPLLLKKGDKVVLTTLDGSRGSNNTVTVNYSGFTDDVEVGDHVLVDGGLMSFVVETKTETTVSCRVEDGGLLKSRRHLNVRGKSANLPSITAKDWEDIEFGVQAGVDFYALSFVKDAGIVHELSEFLKSRQSEAKILVKIESADSIKNLYSILEASDGAMVARGDLGAELPFEEVPILQKRIIDICRKMGKPVIVATNMLESMIENTTPTRAEVSDIAVAVREGADAVMLSGETAFGAYALKSLEVMTTVAERIHDSMGSSGDLGLQRENTLLDLNVLAQLETGAAMSHTFAYHATLMSNTIGTPLVVFTRKGTMAALLSQYRPFGLIFAFTDNPEVQRRLALYHGVHALGLDFSDDAEETFNRALGVLKGKGLIHGGQQVAVVRSGQQPIWRQDSTHLIQVKPVPE